MTTKHRHPLEERAAGIISALTGSGAIGVGLVDDGFRIVYANAAATALTGLTPDTIVGRSFFDLLGPHETARVKSIIESRGGVGEDYYAIGTRGQNGSERELLMATLPLGPTDGSGPTMVLGLFFDLGRLMSGEGSLVKNARLFQQAFDLSERPIFIQDLAGAMRLTNQAFCRDLLGLERHRVIGRTPADLARDLPDPGLVELLRVDPSGLHSERFRFRTGRLTCVDGREHDFEIQRTVLQGVDHEPQGVVNIMLDVTRRLDAERRLESTLEDTQRLNDLISRQRDMLVQTEELASVGRLAAGVAHEINNPLSYVQSNIKALGESLGVVAGAIEAVRSCVERSRPGERPDPEELRRILDDDDVAYALGDAEDLVADSLQGADRIGHIVDSLQGLTRRDQGKAVEVAVTEMVEAALVLVRHHLDGRCRLETAIGDVPPLECYPDQIEHALLNLLVNAGEAIREDGTVTIEARAVAPGVCITVRDDGVGILPEHRERIFEPFFSARDGGDGTGLGLHIVATIVERHGGRVEVESNPGVGTAVHVFLPRRRPA